MLWDAIERLYVQDKGKVNFFSFPTENQEKRQLWIKAVKRSNWEPKRWTKIILLGSVTERSRLSSTTASVRRLYRPA